MILGFFEGPAGSGKTHQLIERARTVAADMLSDENRKLLALTFMNGARQRLTARFASAPGLHGRFLCLTFDAFAGMIVHRRRSLLRNLSAEQHDPAMSSFDRICTDAARLLELPSVASWIGASFPLIVVDEAQDLDECRFRILRALGACSTLLAAADEFQNLRGDISCGDVMAWLRQAQTASTLSTIHRTSHEGLLGVAGALRTAQDVCTGLTSNPRGFCPSHSAAGIRIVEPHAKNTGGLAWAVADELSRMGERTVILTPDAQGQTVRKVLSAVHANSFNRNKKAGLTFGPYPLHWERREEDEAARLLGCIPGDAAALSIEDASAAVDALDTPDRHRIRRRIEHARNVRGQAIISREELREVIEGALRDASRGGFRQGSGRRVMTIARAKNREFNDVLVLWPHTAAGSAEDRRRLLYNAVTRAKDNCSVVVFGQGRLQKAPFAAG